MRAREFLNEVRAKPISKRQQYGTVGLNTYTDVEGISSTYVMNRLGMAVACTDGVTPPDMPAKSWIGKSKSTHPYTAQEQEMLKLAYRAVGAKYTDVNKGDLDSEEPPGGNTESPIRPFRGYPR